MQSFMSASTQTSQKVTKPATECGGGCDGKAVKSTGQESIEKTGKEQEGTTQATEPATNKPEQVVVMQGPLGTAITEALKKSLSKTALMGNVQVPGAALESNALEYVQANGQINNSNNFITKLSRAVGLVPMVDNTPTAVNTLLDCASKVDDIEFILVNRLESSPNESIVPEKALVQSINGGEAGAALESLVIDSVQVVVTYRKCAKDPI